MTIMDCIVCIDVIAEIALIVLNSIALIRVIKNDTKTEKK